MKRNVLILFSFLFALVYSQKKQEPSISLMFYNTENLFDYYDDPLTDDNEFLPTSRRHWTKEKYNSKINNLGKLILSIGAQPPVFIGMAEVENYKVLEDLVKYTGLDKFNYKIIHYESPDPRGIDVAAIYRPDMLKIISSKSIRIYYSKESKRKTRDILYVKGICHRDTIHFLVNHWPSRRGGKKSSDPFRSYVASVLRNQTDSILKKSIHSKIIICGDFNDEPDDKSLQILTQNSTLNNLSADWLKNTGFIGTHYFKGQWAILDQIIVSQELLHEKGIYFKSARIYQASFLFNEDKTFGGKNPFRTYTGMKYTGGFSDHLPVILDLYNQ